MGRATTTTRTTTSLTASPSGNITLATTTFSGGSSSTRETTLTPSTINPATNGTTPITITSSVNGSTSSLATGFITNSTTTDPQTGQTSSTSTISLTSTANETTTSSSTTDSAGNPISNSTSTTTTNPTTGEKTTTTNTTNFTNPPTTTQNTTVTTRDGSLTSSTATPTLASSSTQNNSDGNSTTPKLTTFGAINTTGAPNATTPAIGNSGGGASIVTPVVTTAVGLAALIALGAWIKRKYDATRNRAREFQGNNRTPMYRNPLFFLENQITESITEQELEAAGIHPANSEKNQFIALMMKIGKIPLTQHNLDACKAVYNHNIYQGPNGQGNRVFQDFNGLSDADKMIQYVQGLRIFANQTTFNHYLETYNKNKQAEDASRGVKIRQPYALHSEEAAAQIHAEIAAAVAAGLIYETPVRRAEQREVVPAGKIYSAAYEGARGGEDYEVPRDEAGFLYDNPDDQDSAATRPPSPTYEAPAGTAKARTASPNRYLEALSEDQMRKVKKAHEESIEIRGAIAESSVDTDREGPGSPIYDTADGNYVLPGQVMNLDNGGAGAWRSNTQEPLQNYASLEGQATYDSLRDAKSGPPKVIKQQPYAELGAHQIHTNPESELTPLTKRKRDPQGGQAPAVQAGGTVVYQASTEIEKEAEAAKRREREKSMPVYGIPDRRTLREDPDLRRTKPNTDDLLGYGFGSEAAPADQPPPIPKRKPAATEFEGRLDYATDDEMFGEPKPTTTSEYAKPQDSLKDYDEPQTTKATRTRDVPPGRITIKPKKSDPLQQPDLSQGPQKQG